MEISDWKQANQPINPLTTIATISYRRFYLRHTWFVQLQTNTFPRTFQGFFKGKFQFSRTKIYLINRHSLTPSDHLIGKNTSWNHLPILLLRPSWITIFLLLFRNEALQSDCVWLSCNCIWGTEIAFEIKKQKYNIVHAQNVFTLPVSFTGSYTEDEANVPRQNNLI